MFYHASPFRTRGIFEVRRYGFILFFAGSLFGLIGRYYAYQWGGAIGLLAWGEIWVVGGLISSIVLMRR